MKGLINNPPERFWRARSASYFLLAVSIAIFFLTTAWTFREQQQDSSSHNQFSNTLRGSGAAVSVPLGTIQIAAPVERPLYAAPFDHIPSPRSLSERQKRITLIAVWTGGHYKSYLWNYIHSARLNNDTIDLLFINRGGDEDAYIDWEAHGVDMNQGGNVKLEKMSDKRYNEMHAEYLCGEEGWKCDATQKAEVTEEMMLRPDELNCDWKPQRGSIFRSLFIHPENPFWAWSDADMHYGNFNAFPFHFLSHFSFLTFMSWSPDLAFLAGQFVAFNLDDPHLPSAWMKVKTLESVDAFVKHTNGRHPWGALDEGYWSRLYLRSDEYGPGQNLSWAILPSALGKDAFERPSHELAISGRDIYIVENSLGRADLELFFQVSRTSSMLTFPRWTEVPAVLEEMRFDKGTECGKAYWFDINDAQCIPTHKLARPGWLQSARDNWTGVSLVRASYIRFSTSPPGIIHRRIDLDARPSGFRQKLMLHYQEIKRQEWFAFPEFGVGEDKVMVWDGDKVDVWSMGEGRDVDVFHRQTNGENVVG